MGRDGTCQLRCERNKFVATKAEDSSRLKSHPWPLSWRSNSSPPPSPVKTAKLRVLRWKIAWFPLASRAYSVTCVTTTMVVGLSLNIVHGLTNSHDSCGHCQSSTFSQTTGDWDCPCYVENI